MNENYINALEIYLSNVDDIMYKKLKNSIEKINIMTKIEELIFWLEQYKSEYLTKKKKEIYDEKKGF